MSARHIPKVGPVWSRLPNIDKSLLVMPGVTHVHIPAAGDKQPPRTPVRPVLGLPYIHSSKTDIRRAFALERNRLMGSHPPPQHIPPVVAYPAPTFPYPGGIQP